MINTQSSAISHTTSSTTMKSENRLPNLPMDVVTYILSFLPVKNMYYDNCMDQLLYWHRIYDERKSRRWSVGSRHTYILNQTHMKGFFVMQQRFGKIISKRRRIRREQEKLILDNTEPECLIETSNQNVI